MAGSLAEVTPGAEGGSVVPALELGLPRLLASGGTRERAGVAVAAGGWGTAGACAAVPRERQAGQGAVFLAVPFSSVADRVPAVWPLEWLRWTCPLL